MKNTFFTSYMLLLFLGGCATTTQEIITRPSSPAPQVSETIEHEAQKGLKRKVAIARFTNETKHASSFLLDEHNDKIGKQASDILAARLVESGKFLLFERQDLTYIQNEQDLSGISSEVIGADFLIVGSISEFGRNTVGKVGIFSRTKRQQARAVVNVRLIDVRTGQITFSEEGTGEALSEAGATFGIGTRAGYDSSLDDKALSAAISKMISNLIENLLDRPWTAYILDVSSDGIIISGGKSQGLKLEDTLRVMKRGKQIKNPQTGFMVELPGTEIARLKVNAFSGKGNNEVSICEVSSGSIADVPLSEIVIQEI